MANISVKIQIGFSPESAKDKWDNIEIHPVIYLPEHDSYEQCDEDDPNIHCWSVYLHQIKGGIQCIADLPTRELAEQLAKLIKNASKSKVKK